MQIAYYVSSHGYGHAARQQPVIQELVRHRVKIHVRSAAPRKFFQGQSVFQHEDTYDVGMIQPRPLFVDPEATFAWYANFLARQADIISREVAYLRQNDIQLVVADMPPVACEIARMMNIPCLVITHFTWDWVYGYYIHEFPQYQYVIDSIRSSYGKATLALKLPFAHTFDMFSSIEEIPLLANPVTRSRTELRQAFDVPDNHHVALLSMGGDGRGDMDITLLRELEGWTFWMMPGAWEQVKDLPNFRLIPKDTDNYHDLLAAADVVVGKAGGSTVSEVIAHQTPMIYTLNHNWRENELLDAALRDFNKSLYIPLEDFQRGNWAHQLNDLINRDDLWPEIRTDGATVAAQRILDHIG